MDVIKTAKRMKNIEEILATQASCKNGDMAIEIADLACKMRNQIPLSQEEIALKDAYFKKTKRMKSIKEKAEEYLLQNKDEILCVYDRYAGFVDGANYVLDEIEKCVKSSSNSRLKIDTIKQIIELLKK